MRANLFYLVLGASVFGACATPSPVFRQIPYQQAGTWYQGLEYVVAKGDAGQMVMAFQRIEGLDMVFDIEIQNLSDTAFLVDPREFYAIALPFRADHNFWEESEGSLTEENYRWAYDPEEVLLDLDKRMARVDADRRNSQTASIITAVAAVGAVAIAAASSDGESTSNDVDNGDTFVDIAPIIVEDGQDEALYAESLESEKRFWESQVLRKTTLAPNAKIRGRVYFSMLKEARYNYFYIQVGPEVLKLVFEQKRVG